MITMRDAYAEINFCSGRTQHSLPIADRFKADGDQRAIDRGDAATEIHLDAVRVIG